ncbi:hypothetical protein TSMEX_007146 [Taenia solium]|eukprot:TsM_000373300 transcript=TsM_000373300 gene=TsM_000373300
MDILYKLLTCCNKSNYGIGNSLVGGFDGDQLNKSLIKLIHNMGDLDQFASKPWCAQPSFGNHHGICIPFAFGIVCGLGFHALESAFFNTALLNETQKASGLVLFATPIHLLGRGGVWTMFIVILLLLVTSCMFSIVGASSILYHDVLATYIRVSLLQMIFLTHSTVIPHSDTSMQMIAGNIGYCLTDY